MQGLGQQVRSGQEERVEGILGYYDVKHWRTARYLIIKRNFTTETNVVPTYVDML